MFQLLSSVRLLQKAWITYAYQKHKLVIAKLHCFNLPPTQQHVIMSLCIEISGKKILWKNGERRR